MALGSAQAAADQGAILVFSKTAAYRHKSIPAGIAAVEALGEQAGLRVDVSESASAFSDERLARYRAVVFLNTSGDVLDVSQRAAFERFVQRGGGFVGIHSASDTEYDWPWYGRLVGAYFHNHPAIQRAALLVDRDDASTAHLPVRWLRTDEWYNFRDTSWEPLQVLIRLDESSYTGGTMGAMHPITWRHGFDGGRAWYTAMGHTDESYAEPAFRQHLLEGIKWAAGISAP
jgi:type 1 glutamine amidotransferase